MLLNSTNKSFESILYIDDEEQNLTGFKFTFYKDFNVFTALTEEQAWNILEENIIKVVISDQRMPLISGIELLKKISIRFPDTILILMTGYTDLQAIIDAINQVGIYKYIAKPWEKEDVKLILNNAIKSFNLSYENSQLIHDLRISKEKAEESDRLKTAFLTNISHEIRTPLNGMLGFVNLMLENGKENEKFKVYNTYIQSGADELMAIIQNIVEMAEIQSDQTEVIIEDLEMNALINTLKIEIQGHEIFKANDNIKLKAIANDEQIIVKTDKIKIKEIYRHLLDNAIKFTEKGNIQFGYNVANSQLEIWVKDTGIGINPEDIPHIYTRFWKAQFDNKLYRGLGIGLTIVNSYVEELGGTISVYSIPNQLTEFRIVLPCQ
jgi:signal transduction histidine kinase